MQPVVSRICCTSGLSQWLQEGCSRDPTFVPALLAINSFHKRKRWPPLTPKTWFILLGGSSAKRSVMLKTKEFCWNWSTESDRQGSHLKPLKMLWIRISWNCSPGFRIQVKDPASQRSVLWSCSPALPAHSIWLSFHSSPCKRLLGELRSLPQPTTCSTAWYMAGWLQKNWPHVCLMRLFPCPDSLPLRWSGRLHQKAVSVWRARRTLVPPVSTTCGQAVTGLAGCPLPPPSWMGPWLWPRDHPNTAVPREFCFMKLCKRIKNAWGHRNLIFQLWDKQYSPFLSLIHAHMYSLKNWVEIVSLWLPATHLPAKYLLN